jgi:predicted acyltransferase
MEIKRLLSLDAFRGFTIAAMILVNNPGSWSDIYAPLQHAEWNGLTPTDLIFPFFLFIVGVSMAFSYTKLLHSSTPLNSIYNKLIFRSVKILSVGLLLNLIPEFDFANLRYTGVLQRIAIVSLICGFLFLNTGWKTQLITGISILVCYWVAMRFVPTPGYNVAQLEPGVNLAAWIDQQFLPGKLWNKSWDPEGLLSTIPAVVTTIMGMITGKLLLSEKT